MESEVRHPPRSPGLPARATPIFAVSAAPALLLGRLRSSGIPVGGQRTGASQSVRRDARDAALLDQVAHDSGEPFGCQPPAPPGTEHEVVVGLDEFDCGAADLDAWLKRSARTAAASGTAATYVLCLDDRVVGYYALAMSSVTHDRAPSRLRRGMPDSVPVVLLARLAVDRSEQGRRARATGVEP